MEGFFTLLALTLIGCVFVLPIAAFVRSGRAVREAEALRETVNFLSAELRRLRERLDAQTPAEPETPPTRATRSAEPSPAPMREEAPQPPPPLTTQFDVLAKRMAQEGKRAEAGKLPEPAPIPVLSAKQVSPPPPLVPGPLTPRYERVAADPEEIPAPEQPSAPMIDWEKFMGVKLFSWLGGFALFLAAAYFVRYSFEHNLIPPEVRVSLGFLLGMGLITGGVVMKKKQYTVTSQTLQATGVLVLYAVTFACRAVYHFEFFGPGPTFLLMVLITATAFTLAVRLDAMVVAILGMLGGFLTPVLLSTGVDNPVGLFGYIALLDAGLIAVALARRWHFLAVLAALGTVGMELGWSEKFFTVEKMVTAMVVFLGFDALFLAGNEAAHRRKQENWWFQGAAGGLALVTMLYAMTRLSYDTLGQRPGLLGLLVLGADLCLLALVLREPRLSPLQLVGGALANLFVAMWTMHYVSSELLFWGLGLVLVFAVLHSLFPLVQQKYQPEAGKAWLAHLFPPLALALLLIPLVKLATVSILIWPVILLVNALAIRLAVVTASMLSILVVMVLTVGVAALWIGGVRTENLELPLMLTVVGGTAALFFFAGLFALRKMADRGVEVAEEDPLARALRVLGFPGMTAGELQRQLPALSAVLPFLLLILITLQMPLPRPSPVFALALALVVLMLSVARTFGMMTLTAVGLGCSLALEYIWHSHHFNVTQAPVVPLLWYLAFTVVFAGFPFANRAQCREAALPWIVGALAAPLHFALIYPLVKAAWPNGMMGLLPAAFALPALGCVVLLLKWFPAEHSKRNTVLAWFGGAALFFITLIFPIQFERQWLTVAWALEGAALCWLFHRVPHPGLRVAGVALLVVVFARLGLNPAVLGYHPRGTMAILNWYLYSYGLAAACLFAAARLLAPPHDRVGPVNAPALLNTLGVILSFLLLNFEIADYFSVPGQEVLTFQFSGIFARDMTYTISWALFALGLVVVGMRKRIAAARYAGLGLLSVTLLKLFFHDLAELNQLYRIGALAAVAVVAMVASFLYQRFLAVDPPKDATKSTP